MDAEVATIGLNAEDEVNPRLPVKSYYPTDDWTVGIIRETLDGWTDIQQIEIAYYDVKIEDKTARQRSSR